MRNDGYNDKQWQDVRTRMGELIYLEEYKNKILEDEIFELRRQLQLVISSLPEIEPSGFFLTLEEMDRIEKAWAEEKSKK